MRERDIDNEIEEIVASPIVKFLGVKRVEQLKDRICELILQQIEDDLRDNPLYLIPSDEIQNLNDEVVEEIYPKLKKKIEKKLQDWNFHQKQKEFLRSE